MPLINIQTNLKSLGFGRDRPNGGSSNQPYIQNPVDINLGIDQNSVGGNILGSDFLLRGGVLGAVNASATDFLRISKFFNPIAQGGSFKGALFIAKQELLEQQGVKVVDGRSKIYNPLSTLAQVAVNAIGGHLDRTGLNPFKAGYYNSGNTGYWVETKKNDEPDVFRDGSHNRLQLLYQVKRIGTNTSDQTELKRQFQLRNNANGLALGLIGIGALGTFGALRANAPLYQTLTTSAIGVAGLGLLFSLPKNKQVPIKLAAKLYGITNAEDTNNLIEYSGGPGSILGLIGKTNIRIWNKLQFKNYPNESSNITNNGGALDKPKLYLTPTGGSINGPKRKFGSQTSFSRTRNGTDQVVNPNLSVSPDNDFAYGDDIIDFQFQLINNDKPDAPTILNFRAYIDDFSDSFNGDWDAYKYVGRGENFYKYKGFTRDMGISFVAPVLSRADMINTYQKLNGLVWSTTPDYSGTGLMRGTLVKFTMGDYLRDAIVIIKSLAYTPIMEMGFDINRDIDGTRFQRSDSQYTGQLPKGIKVQCNIIPLTQGVGEINNTNYYYTPQRGEAFIGNRDHTIHDRENISAQYGNENQNASSFAPDFTPQNPLLSPLMPKQTSFPSIDSPIPSSSPNTMDGVNLA
jgi:hypothetical protein